MSPSNILTKSHLTCFMNPKSNSNNVEIDGLKPATFILSMTYGMVMEDQKRSYINNAIYKVDFG